VHAAEAEILADPRNERILAHYATDEMFLRQPEGWDQSRYHVKPATVGRLLAHGDVIDLGDRAFEVVHTPGHSPGGIGLFEAKTGIFLSGDIVYDGPLIDDAYHSDVPTYVETMERLRSLPVSIVHGGHFPSFGPTRFCQLIDEYVTGRRKAGCHLG
jgi:glyoxylase-like metal-dependent hydrolase (beta-lactamase superfamily II)